MALSHVVFVDTSIILHLVGVDGDDRAREVADEVAYRRKQGERLILTVTALIEAGNNIAQQPTGRRQLAEKLKKLIEAANVPNPPWILRDATLDQQFVDELLDGNSTASDLVTLLGDGRLGTGDVAILVERDQFKRKVAHTSVEVWTLDDELAAYN